MTHTPSLKLIIKHLDYKIPCNLETDIETPLETNLETPLEIPLEIPLETNLEAPLETNLEIPLETNLEIPLETNLEAPLETNLETPLETNLETPLFETIIEIPPEIPTETFQETTPEIDIKECLPQYDILGFTPDQLSNYTKAMQNLVNNYNLHRCGSTLENNILAQFNNEIDLIIK
jgi:hypothetical protein